MPTCYLQCVVTGIGSVFFTYYLDMVVCFFPPLWTVVYFQTRQGLFAVDTGSGNVTVHDKLDYETEKVYQLEIMAVVRTQIVCCTLNSSNITNKLVSNTIS